LNSCGYSFGSLRDAADYIMALPTAEQNPEEWQIAISALGDG
jgi:hypothetical protein